MDTHEFEFPGGSAVVTTTTGGTRDAPDFCVSVPDASEFAGNASVFAAEILKLASRVEELESAVAEESDEAELKGIALRSTSAAAEAKIAELETTLAAAGEERENMENQLSARIAELEAEVERRAAENIAVQDKSRSVTETLLAVAALFKGTPEAKIAKLEAERATVAEVANNAAAAFGFTDRLPPVAAVKRLAESSDVWMAKYKEADAWRLAGLGRETAMRANLQDVRYELDKANTRLFRLDGFLESESVPEGLRKAFADEGDKGWTRRSFEEVAWRWFREQFSVTETVEQPSQK